MGWLWLVIGLGCSGLIVLAAVGIVYLASLDRKRKDRTLKEGDHTTAWLVQANMNLFVKGLMDLPALVLISPDPEVMKDEEYLSDLAGRIMELKGTDPADCDDKDDAFVAGLMSSETYVEGKRDKLPRRFAKGLEMYLAHIFVYRNHLPGNQVTGERIPCAVIWDDPKSLICTRPPTKKAGRR